MTTGGCIMVAAVRIVVKLKMSLSAFRPSHSAAGGLPRHPTRLYRLPPHLALQRLGMLELRFGLGDVGEPAVGLDARVDVGSERFAKLRLGRRRDEINPEVRGAHGVRLVDDWRGARGEAGQGAREGKRDHKSEEGEARALERAESRRRRRP